MVRVAGSSCGTERADKSSGRWTHGLCGCRRCSQRTVVGAGGRALPSPGALLVCLAPGQPGAGSAPAVLQAVPPSSLPAALPGAVALPRGCLLLWGPFPAQLSISTLPANLELSMAVCPASLVLPCWEYVRGLAGGCSCFCLVWGCQNPLSPHPGPHSLCPAMASPSQKGALGEQQSQQAGNRLWKHRHDSACWAVGHSLEVVGTSLGLG